MPYATAADIEWLLYVAKVFEWILEITGGLMFLIWLLIAVVTTKKNP